MANTQTPAPPSAPPKPKPAATPPAAPADVTKDGEQPKSSFIRRMANNTTIHKVDDDQELPQDSRPLHVKLAEIEYEQKQRAEAEVEDEDPPAAPAPPPAPKKRKLIKIQTDMEAAKPAAPAPTQQQQPAAPAPAKPEPEVDPYAGLDEEQKFTLQIMEFAEEQNKYKGMSDKFRSYFDKLKTWESENPDAMDSEKEEFITQNMPKITPYEARKLEREYLLQEAEKRLSKKMSKLESEIEEEKKRNRVKPLIEQAVTQMESALAVDPEVPEGDEAEPIFSEMVKTLAEEGPKAAAEKYEDEYTVYQNHLNAGREYMGIIEGTVPYDPKNGLHQWLSTFLSSQEQAVASDPRLSNFNGRKFVTQNDYLRIQQEHPEQLQNYYTLQPEDIMNCLVLNAQQDVKKMRENFAKKAERYGFKRGGVEKQQQQGPPAPEVEEEEDDDPPSPPASMARQNGAAVPAKPKKGLFGSMLGR